MPAYLLILILLLCSGAWWLINYKFKDKVQQPFKFLINCVIIGVAIYYFLLGIGVLGKIKGIQVPSL